MTFECNSEIVSAGVGVVSQLETVGNSLLNPKSPHPTLPMIE